ncbi:hypothetical protein FOA52_010988 [Chlamydomonas sp. UWO 241]|nr:hypothetical protein FOA52_010988 [Chlamydomonas sp. UWO 241]
MVATATLLDNLMKPLTSLNKVADLKQGIAEFYDESSALWEEMWGEHMHHGFYPKGGAPKSNQQAQIDMIEEALSFAGITKAGAMVDVGCGIGGSSRYIAKKFGCTSRGITLSPKQAARANEVTSRAGLAEKASFQVGDALAQPFEDASFDLVWSMESGEHMPDKAKFVGELARVCAPGGAVIVVTWCHRILADGESLREEEVFSRRAVDNDGATVAIAAAATALRGEEASLLERICEAYYLPAWCSVADYEMLFAAQGLTGIKTADWSEEVAPFWGAVIQTALSGAGLLGLLKAGWGTIKGALVMPLMAQGFQMGLIKFNIITARKPL